MLLVQSQLGQGHCPSKKETMSPAPVCLDPWADRGSRKEIRVQCEGYCSNSDKRKDGVLVEQAYK